jgi:antimicrobial peptide system SdpA family protein
MHLRPKVPAGDSNPNVPVSNASTTSQRHLEPRQIWMLNGALSCFWIAVFLAVLVTMVEQSAFLPSRMARVVVQAYSPQGWAFFTRNPREAWRRTYRVDPDKTLHSEDVADYRGAPWNGLDRSKRNRGIMAEQVAGQIPKDAWRNCKSSAEQCMLEYDRAVVHATLQANDTTGLCGRLLFQEAQTVPWAWRASYHRVNMPSRVAMVDVKCITEMEHKL